MRFPAIPTILLLLIAMAALVVLPNFVVPMPERHVLSNVLSKQWGMQISLNGDMQLRFLPRPQIILQDVQLVGSTADGDALTAHAPQLIVALDVQALTQQKFDVSLVTLLAPQIDAKLVTSFWRRVRSRQSGSHPGLQIIDAKIAVSGLNQIERARRLSLPALNITIPARKANAAMQAQFTHPMANGEKATARFNISPPIGGRYQLQTDIRLGRDEKISFEGVLATARDWQLDGELAFASGDMLAQSLQHHVPLSVRPNARYVAFEGLVRGDARGIRTGSLEVQALNTMFQTRLALVWPQSEDEMPRLSGRLSTGTIDLNNFTMVNPQATQGTIIEDAWRGLLGRLAVSLQLEANRFDLAGESGSDLSLEADWRGDLVDIGRLSLDLPFRSALIAAGTLNMAKGRPHFTGSFSARSLDTLAALLWLGDQAGQDFAEITELVDDVSVQRTSLVGDVDWSINGLALSGLSGRIGEDRFAGNMTIADWEGPRADIDLDFDRFDLSDWGVSQTGNARNVDVKSVWQPLNRLLESQLSEADESRIIGLNFSAEQLYSGTSALGPVRVHADIINRTLDLHALQLSNINAARLLAAGRLSYNELPAHGRLQIDVASDALNDFASPLLTRLAPLRFASNAPLSIEAELLLPARNAPDWPNAKLNGEGLIGDMRLGFDVVTPSRLLDYSVSGSTVSVAMAGAANGLASALFLPDMYAPSAQGRLQLELAAQSNNVSALSSDLVLAGDSLEINGSLRPSAEGRLLEGTLSFAFADSLPLLGLQSGRVPVPLSARSQVNGSAKKIGFSGVQGQFGNGTINGEGVLQLADAAPQLNANLLIDNVNFGWMLPRFDGKAWSDDAMRWPILERGNADLDMRLSNVKLGRLPVDKMAGRLRLIDGVLEVPEVNVELLGGTMSGRVQVEGGQLTPLFSLEGGFSNINPSRALRAQFGSRLVDAALSGNAVLRGRGSSAAAMMASLNGDVQVEIGEGVLGFIDMKGLSIALADKERQGKAAKLVSEYIGAGDMPFTRGLGLMQWRDGRSRNATAEFIGAAPYNDAQLSLDMDAVTRQISGRFTMYPQEKLPLIWQLSEDVMAPKITLTAQAYDVEQITDTPLNPQQDLDAVQSGADENLAN